MASVYSRVFIIKPWSTADTMSEGRPTWWYHLPSIFEGEGVMGTAVSCIVSPLLRFWVSLRYLICDFMEQLDTAWEVSIGFSVYYKLDLSTWQKLQQLMSLIIITSLIAPFHKIMVKGHYVCKWQVTKQILKFHVCLVPRHPDRGTWGRG